MIMNQQYKKVVELDELKEIFAICNRAPQFFKITKLHEFIEADVLYPIYAIEMTHPDFNAKEAHDHEHMTKKRPTLLLTGGVHGLERIGTQVILSYMSTISHRISWDKITQDICKDLRVIFIPIINPWGMKHLRRANHNGVDLMRNAPIEAEKPTFLVGGHRISKHLPWYRGSKNKMEAEVQSVTDFVLKAFEQSKSFLSVDFHSGFGTKDQIWYPFAKSTRPFYYHEQMLRLFDVYESTYPHHIYTIEPQAKNYTTHGDFWDYLLDKHFEQYEHQKVFIPLTLELGSWNWIKKNPIQIFSMFGLFNPIKKHRYSRTMRRHIHLMDFLVRALQNSNCWEDKNCWQQLKRSGAP